METSQVDRIEVFARGNGMVIQPKGPLTFEDATLLRQQLLVLMDMRVQYIIFDFKSVSEIDPLCLQVLLIFARNLEGGYQPKLVMEAHTDIRSFWISNGLNHVIHFES